jgi:AcrR family transcriptional regulator
MAAPSARNPFETRDVLSRRGGPAKEPLSRDRIVTEALRLLTREGLEGMSLRRVATALETGPASLYAYVDDLQSLQALVLDRALAAVDIRGGKRRGWRERLKSVLESYARVLFKSRGLAQLALGAIAVGPNALRILDTLLGLLEEGGVDRATAAWAVDLLVLYVTAIAAEQSERPSATDALGLVAHAIARAPADEYPHVHAASAELVSGDGEERFAWAIEVLVSGVLRRPRPRAGGKRGPGRKPGTR